MEERSGGGVYVVALLVATAVSFVFDAVVVVAGGEFDRLVSLFVWLVLILVAVVVATVITGRRKG